jgi:hypothetical protein
MDNHFGNRVIGIQSSNDIILYGYTVWMHTCIEAEWHERVQQLQWPHTK